jgi:hypothetical protein
MAIKNEKVPAGGEMSSIRLIDSRKCEIQVLKRNFIIQALTYIAIVDPFSHLSM